MTTLATRPRRLLWLAALALLSLAPAAPAPAQSTHDLRDENDRLKGQVAELQKDLEAAKLQIAALQQEIAQLKAAAKAAPAVPHVAPAPPASPPPPEVTIDESVLTASPRAMFNAMVRSYAEAMQGIPRGREGRVDRDNYLRHVERWAGGAKRDFTNAIEWTVRVVNPERDLLDGRRVEVVAVDPKTDVELGDTFDITLDKAQAERLYRIWDRDELGPLQLKGVAEASAKINPRRETRGTFDHPTYIGPFAEYSFRVTAKSLMPPPAPGSTAPTAPAPAPAPAQPAPPPPQPIGK